MVVVSYSGKEINAKLVYYGCGLCGKTTNLEAIYEAVPDTSRGKMVSMKTQSDRTLFFDLLPLDLGEIMGFKTRFLLYTVPGQVFYNATRKLVLKGADAVVFVADSEVGKMEENKESLENLRVNLAEYRVNLDEIPWVLQYNKRDLPNIYSIEELQKALDPTGKVPHFEAVATNGNGVFVTFRGISHLLMEKVTKELRRGSNAPQPSRPAPGPESAVPTRAETVSRSASPAAPAQTISREAQVARAENPPPATLDYGREIELPAQIPPAGPVSAPPVKREPVPVAAVARVEEVEPVTAPAAASAPAVERHAPPSAPQVERHVAPSVPKAEPARPAPASPFTRPPAVETQHVREAAAPEEVVRPASREVAKPAPRETRAVVAGPEATDSASTTSVVVPITLPANGSAAELVIRIVLKRAD